MSDNPFKKYSILEIEECVAKALTELLGDRVNVQIDGLRLTHVIDGRAEFSVTATHSSTKYDDLLLRPKE